TALLLMMRCLAQPLLLLVQRIWCQVCPHRCQCPKEPPACPPGVPLVLDDCICCLVCARQKGQACSDMNPCDTRKGLQCDYSADIHKRTGICTAVCVIDGSVYQNGQTFFPSCKYQCICRDGQVACVSRCNVDVMLPGPDCPMPRRIQVPGECCEKWVCEPQAGASALGGFAMAAYRQEETVSFDAWDRSLNCIEQTTEWGACSQTCGMGVSTRQQVQLTQLAQKRGSRCQKMVRSSKAIHLSYKNCTSVQAYKPRFCGSCTDGRCCTPHRTKTALVEFQCANGKTTRRPLMVITTCACHRHCPRDNAAWPPSELGYTGMQI
uniref:Cellular communication network factor 3 n=1 Tax=Neolamprologus brichardi TaxID=32507 RepID=A0A3Q4I8A8_NEOBR